MEKFSLLFILFTLSVLLVSGCTTSHDYEQPQYVTRTIPTLSHASSVQVTTQAQQAPIVKTFNVGDSATDGKLKVILNSRSFTTESGNQYVTPKPGSHYLVLDVTVENLQSDKSNSFSSLMQFGVTDADGYAYNEDIMAMSLISKGWKDGSDILPGAKRRGNVVFEVPTDAKGLQFLFKFDFGGQTAVFNL
jgi:hypothetical protein